MRLINGLPSNGTYLGIIPAQRANTNVALRIFFKDDLNYSSTITRSIKVNSIAVPYITKGDKSPTSRESPTVYTLVAHYDSEVKNVTLFYHKGLDPKFISILMKNTKRYQSSYPFARDIDNL